MGGFDSPAAIGWAERLIELCGDNVKFTYGSHLYSSILPVMKYVAFWRKHRVNSFRVFEKITNKKIPRKLTEDAKLFLDGTRVMKHVSASTEAFVCLVIRGTLSLSADHSIVRVNKATNEYTKHCPGKLNGWSEEGIKLYFELSDKIYSMRKNEQLAKNDTFSLLDKDYVPKLSKKRGGRQRSNHDVGSSSDAAIIQTIEILLANNDSE